jgi:hypothetical protein
MAFLKTARQACRDGRIGIEGFDYRRGMFVIYLHTFGGYISPNFLGK